MKKNILVIGVVFTSLLMISTVTAVPQTHSKPAMNTIEQIEERRSLVETLEHKMSLGNDFQANGIIDWLIQLLSTILDFIQTLIAFVLELFQIVNLVNAIISAINQLIDLITQLIQAINDIITPGFQYQ